MSKGSKRRPAEVSDEQVTDSWDSIFKTSMGQVVQDSKVEETKAGASSQATILPVSPSRGDKNKG